MSVLKTFCPICHKGLQPGEELVAKYVPEHNWWVIFHTLDTDSMHPSYPITHVMNAFCAKAGYRMDIISPAIETEPNESNQSQSSS